MTQTATEAFVDQLLDLGVMLPLHHCGEHVGSVVDDDDNEVLVIDPNRQRSDKESVVIADIVIAAVNRCGGFAGETNDG